ncbi:MAG TPA: DUF1559 domain-containing protein [Pirellulales bacterium]|nr:DUF1559 domain-containing protein [Pirellulales bacterium]
MHNRANAKSPALLLAAAIACLVPDAASTVEPTKSERRTAVVAPFVDDQTLLILALNWPEANLSAAIELLSSVRPGAADLSEARAALAALTECGVREAYLIGKLADLTEGSPLLVVPVSGSAEADKVVKLLKEQFSAAEVCNSTVVAGDARTVADARRLSSRPRPEIDDAFKAVDSAAMQILFLPSADQRAVLEAVLPRLPSELGSKPITTVTHGCRWAALGVHVQPQKSLQLVVRSADEASADAFRALWEEVVRIACRHPDVVDAMPKLDNASQTLTPLRRGDRLLLELDADKKQIAALSALLRAPAALARDASNRAQSRQNLLMLGLAFETYGDKYRALPPAAICSSWGIPLLSWRVQLLPFLGEEDLYRRFRLDEPWNSKHNRQLIELMPAVFRRLGRHGDRTGRTPYLTPRGKGTALNAREPTPYDAFRDTTSSTILLVEADTEHEVVWTQPADLDYNADKPLVGLDEPRSPGFMALFADAHVRLIPQETDTALLRALFTRAGGEQVDLDD